MGAVVDALRGVHLACTPENHKLWRQSLREDQQRRDLCKKNRFLRCRIQNVSQHISRRRQILQRRYPEVLLPKSMCCELPPDRLRQDDESSASSITSAQFGTD